MSVEKRGFWKETGCSGKRQSSPQPLRATPPPRIILDLPLRGVTSTISTPTPLLLLVPSIPPPLLPALPPPAFRFHSGRPPLPLPPVTPLLSAPPLPPRSRGGGGGSRLLPLLSSGPSRRLSPSPPRFTSNNPPFSPRRPPSLRLAASRMPPCCTHGKSALAGSALPAACRTPQAHGPRAGGCQERERPRLTEARTPSSAAASPAFSSFSPAAAPPEQSCAWHWRGHHIQSPSQGQRGRGGNLPLPSPPAGCKSAFRKQSEPAGGGGGGEGRRSCCFPPLEAAAGIAGASLFTFALPSLGSPERQTCAAGSHEISLERVSPRLWTFYVGRVTPELGEIQRARRGGGEGERASERDFVVVSDYTARFCGNFFSRTQGSRRFCSAPRWLARASQRGRPTKTVPSPRAPGLGTLLPPPRREGPWASRGGCRTPLLGKEECLFVPAHQSCIEHEESTSAT